MKKLKNWMKSKEHKAFFILMMIVVGFGTLGISIHTFPFLADYILGGCFVFAVLALLKVSYDLILLHL